ncbi:MAG TPA: copper resistance CopC family protein [Candidatus Acidoferrum sp.]|nr:copper resistance CopC family protein [Candidatus Acidoferrum sp.]
MVIESSPKENEVLTRAPTVVVLRFSAKIEKSLTRVSLTTNNGRMIPLPTAVEKSSSETPDRLEIRLPGLEPGEYTLRYTVLSTDGHATSGALHFRVVSRP